MFVCKKCGHKCGTIGGIRGHVWAKHRNRGKDKKSIRKSVDFALAEPNGITADGLSLLSSDTLVKIVQGTYKLNPIQQASLNELSKR